MSKPVPRSRLNITYRTRIEGEPKKVKLPMRFLVLGNFSGKNESLLSERPMQSLLPGMRIDSFMQEMKIAAPIEPRDLAMTLVGKLTGTITGVFKKPPEATDTTATVKLTGKGEVAGRGKDNGLGDFAGEVTLVGEHDFTLENGSIKLAADGEKIKLQAKGKVEPPGDFDAGITGAVDGTVEVVIKENTASSGLDTSIDLGSPVASDDVKVALTIPLRSIADFRPDALAARVPEIRRLVLLRRLVLELRGYISGNPLLGVALREELDKAQAELAAATATDAEPLRSKQTTIAQLKAALVETHPQLLIDPPGPIGGPN